MRVTICSLILLYSATIAVSQSLTSRNNYSGKWENPESWMPVWNEPTDTVSGTDAIIYGLIGTSGDLSFKGSDCNLIVRDTLIVNGDLYLKNNADLLVEEGGILIVRGNLIFSNNPGLLISGYLIIEGDVINNSSTWGGYFTSTIYPSKVFISGNQEAPESSLYPVLNCSDSLQWPHTFSGCNYGNQVDLMNDPVYFFLHPSCGTIKANYNGPVCEGDSLKFSAELTDFTVDNILRFEWKGPAGFYSDKRSPVVPAAKPEISGIYILTVQRNACSLSDSILVVVNPLPDSRATSNSPVCEGETLTLTAADADRYVWSGPGNFNSTERNPVLAPADTAMSGRYYLKSISVEGCVDTSSLTALVTAFPEAYAGEDQVLENVFETNLNASSQNAELTQWSLVSGSGNLTEPHSASCNVTGLSPGSNVFRWSVQTGNCKANDDVEVYVEQLFIPSVITPNDDGKNDFFEIQGCPEGTELIIFNRWGITEFSTTDYNNDWAGINSTKAELPDDTYFYMLRLKNGIIRKGTILIKRK